MELSRFDLVTIRRALKLLTKVEDGVFKLVIKEDDGVLARKILRSTERTVADILTEYPNASVFEVKPNMLEE